MKRVKKTIDIDQEKLTHVQSAFNFRTEEETLNFILEQFDIDVQLAQVTLKDAGTFDFEEF